MLCKVYRIKVNSCQMTDCNLYEKCMELMKETNTIEQSQDLKKLFMK